MKSYKHTLSNAGLIVMTAALLAGPAVMAQQPSSPEKPAGTWSPKGKPVAYTPPGPEELAQEPNAAEINYGYRLMTDTHRLLPGYVGNQLNCTSCHLAGGRGALSSPFNGIAQRFPQYNARAARIITLADRVNGCMQRSMNGKPLPPDSRELKAMVGYMTWLSKGAPDDGNVKGIGVGAKKIDHTLVPDIQAGQKIYGSYCAACHGTQGEGMRNAKGEMVFPPLWGNESFNIGAGMARLYTAAGFVKHNMPVGHGLNGPMGQGGLLNDQQALDVAAYFIQQPRPDFPGKVNDWPKGGKPKDARY